MQKKQKPRDQTPTRFFTNRLLIQYASVCLTFFTCLHLGAETVYRCGDQYSTSAICADARSAEIKTHTDTHASSRDTASPAARDLREAEALEKSRIRSERQATQSVPARMMDTRQNLQPSNADEIATTVRPRGLRNRRLQSPYFTAKDPNAEPKKKGNAKALPSAEN